jgi:hypothetical protein
MNLRSYYHCSFCDNDFKVDGGEDFTACPACRAAAWKVRTVSVDGEKERELYECHVCGKMTDDPHTHSTGEDCCPECCDVCKKNTVLIGGCIRIDDFGDEFIEIVDAIDNASVLVEDSDIPELIAALQKIAQERGLEVKE